MDFIESSVPEALDCDLSIPRGGPIYVPNMNLGAELSQDATRISDDDVSVDDLKIFTEDELMDRSLKEVFEGMENNENRPPPSDQSKVGGDEKRSRKKQKGTNNPILESGCIEKVEQVVRIKQRQEEDKESARLHSFNLACKINETLKPGRNERMRSLRSTNYTKKVSAAGLQQHIPVTFPEVLLSVEVYHNVRQCVKVLSPPWKAPKQSPYALKDSFPHKRANGRTFLAMDKHFTFFDRMDKHILAYNG